MTSPPAPRTLLRTAVAFALAAFVVVVGYLAREAALRPDVGASLFGTGRFRTGTYWGPFIAFAVAGLGGVAYVFWRALRRVEAGELRGPRERRR